MIYDDNLQVMKIKQMLLTRKVVLVGYSIPFFSKYANMINFSIGFTGSNKKEMQSIDKNSTLEFFHISEFSKIHADDGYMLIACTSAKDWDYNKHLYEKQGFKEGITWISREFAETILDNKEVFFVAGVCTALRLKDVLMELPEFAARYYPVTVQVNLAPNIDGTVKLFHHLEQLGGLYLTTILGGVYNVFNPLNFNLNDACRVYQMPVIAVGNFLFPQLAFLLTEAKNKYRIQETNTKRIPFEYEDKNIIKCVKQGLSPLQTLEYCMDDNLYSAQELQKNIDKNIRFMELAEKDCDLKVADLYRNYYQKIRFSRDPIHVHIDLLKILAKEFCRKLGIPVNTKILRNAEITYYHSEIPIYPSVQKHLNLKWGGRYKV